MIRLLKKVGRYDSSGKSLDGGLSLQEIVADAPQPNEDKIVAYLTNGVGIAGCGGVERDILTPSLEVHLDLDVYSDGVWSWQGNLVYYVKKYHICLPKEFTDHMEANNWIVPKLEALK